MTVEEGAGRLVCLVTCPAGDAERIARAVVEDGHAACVNVVDSVRSIYRWQGEIEDEREALLVVKTTAAAVEALDRLLDEIHPYDVHELIGLPIQEGNERYLDWIAESVGLG